MNKNISPTNLLKFGMLIVSSAATLTATEPVPEERDQRVIAPNASVDGDAPVARDQQVFAPAGEVAPIEQTQQVFAPGAEGAPIEQTQEVFAPAGEVTPIAQSEKVFAPASEEAPVAQFQPVFPPASEGEVAPVAVECGGCEHRPVGGPGPSSGTYEPSNDVGLELRFKPSRNKAVLSFHSVATGATGDENYRVEASSDIRSDATSWYTVWKGSAAQVEANGGISLTMNLKNASHFFRVVVSR